MSLATQISSLATRIATECKALRTLVNGNAADLSALTTTAKTNLVAAVNEVNGKAAGIPASYLDTDGTLAANSDTKVPSQKAVVTYVGARIAAADAFVAKGTIDASANPNYPAANAGDTYRVSVAGKIGGASGVNVEVGDMIMCFVDGTSAGTQAAVGAAWDVIQTNVDGAVVGPGSSTSGNLPTFSGVSGKVIQDSGIAPSTDGTLAANADTKLPTEKAVRTYLAATYYTQTQVGDPTTDFVAVFTAGLA